MEALLPPLGEAKNIDERTRANTAQNYSSPISRAYLIPFSCKFRKCIYISPCTQMIIVDFLRKYCQVKQEHSYLPVFAVFPWGETFEVSAIVNIKILSTGAAMNISALAGVSALNELVKSTLCELPYRITAAAFSFASRDNARQITASAPSGDAPARVLTKILA